MDNSGLIGTGVRRAVNRKVHGSNPCSGARSSNSAAPSLNPFGGSLLTGCSRGSWLARFCGRDDRELGRRHRIRLVQAGLMNLIEDPGPSWTTTITPQSRAIV